MQFTILKGKVNLLSGKYIITTILYILSIALAHSLIDLFTTHTLDVNAKGLETMEELNTKVPDAQIRRGDGIGTKYDNMKNTFTDLFDETAISVDAAEAPVSDKEQYESRYSEEELLRIDSLELERRAAEERAAEEERRREAMKSEQEAFRELEKTLLEAREAASANHVGLPGVTDGSARDALASVADTGDSLLFDPSARLPLVVDADAKKKDRAVRSLADDDKTHEVTKKGRDTSDYFNTLGVAAEENNLIRAFVDEDITAVDGSRVRFRLMDDIEINGYTIKKGTCLYATMSGFSHQRVQGKIKSVLVDDQLLKVSLSIYDLDGQEGMYVPSSTFRETTQEVVGGALNNTMNLNSTVDNTSTVSRWGMQTLQNAYSKMSNALSKAVKKNRAKLKYGSFVYIVNANEKQQNKR